MTAGGSVPDSPPKDVSPPTEGRRPTAGGDDHGDAPVSLAPRAHYAVEFVSTTLARLRRVLEGDPPIDQVVAAARAFADRVRDLMPLLRQVEELLPGEYRYGGGAPGGYDRSAAGEMVRHCLTALASLQHHAAPDCDD